MSDYRRCYVPGATYFFTVNLADRSRALLVEHIDLLRCTFDSIRDSHPFEIDAIVVLPEHLHCIWTLPDGDADYSMRWRQIKADFSRAMPGRERRSASRQRKNERGIWQRRFWEHQVRDEDDFARHVDYIHYNPVKHGHVGRPVDWPHSSIHRFIADEILNADWGTGGLGFDMDLD